MSQVYNKNQGAAPESSMFGKTVRKLARLSWTRYSLLAIVVVYLIWSLLPVLIAFLFSFNGGRSRSVWQGFSFQWWVGPDSVFAQSVYYDAIIHSFVLAILAVLISVPLGILLSIFLARWRGVTAGPVTVFSVLPLVIPEIVLALALFFLVSTLLKFINLGTPAQVVGQVTFILPLVIIIVRGRLASISPHLEEAAIDLGSRPSGAFYFILLPLLQPAILASVVVAFAISIDDFVITQYLSGGASSQTVPMLIYNTARGAASPALNAAAVLVAITTIIVVGFGLLIYKFYSKPQENM